jgi:Delta7-sterol 5-desaturase
MYLGIAGIFHLAYYRRPERAAEWKCQPTRWLSKAQRRQQFILGTLNMVGASVLSGVFVHYVRSGGWTTLYFSLSDHSLAYAAASGLAYYFLTDLLLYWAHRIYHVPSLFRRIHRHHHRYIAPTAITAAAMHPIEFLTYQSIMALPLFVFPVHVGCVIAVLVYSNYFALVDHSGVRTHSWLPWAPPTQFHDDHHAFFHVNYGQNSALWDRLFGSFRREGRKYGADVFGGKGQAAGDERELPPLVDYWKKPAKRPAAEPVASSAAE